MFVSVLLDEMCCRKVWKVGFRHHFFNLIYKKLLEFIQKLVGFQKDTNVRQTCRKVIPVTVLLIDHIWQKKIPERPKLSTAWVRSDDRHVRGHTSSFQGLCAAPTNKKPAESIDAHRRCHMHHKDSLFKTHHTKLVPCTCTHLWCYLSKYKQIQVLAAAALHRKPGIMSVLNASQLWIWNDHSKGTIKIAPKDAELF